MLGLPKNTELNKQLPKTTIYAKFQMNTAAKEKIDSDISKIYIVNEVSSARTIIADGENVKSIYVLLVSLKRKNFDERNIITVSKVIPQNLIMVLEYENEARLAVYHKKLMMTEWQNTNSLSIELKGLDLDKVWENLIVQIGGILINSGNTLEEQIIQNSEKEKLQREINKLEKQARSETQPRKKFELVQRIKSLKNSLEEIFNA